MCSHRRLQKCAPSLHSWGPGILASTPTASSQAGQVQLFLLRRRLPNEKLRGLHPDSHDKIQLFFPTPHSHVLLNRELTWGVIPWQMYMMGAFSVSGPWSRHKSVFREFCSWTSEKAWAHQTQRKKKSKCINQETWPSHWDSMINPKSLDTAEPSSTSFCLHLEMLKGDWNTSISLNRELGFRSHYSQGTNKRNTPNEGRVLISSPFQSIFCICIMLQSKRT